MLTGFIDHTQNTHVSVQISIGTYRTTKDCAGLNLREAIGGLITKSGIRQYVLPNRLPLHPLEYLGKGKIIDTKKNVTNSKKSHA